MFQRNNCGHFANLIWNCGGKLYETTIDIFEVVKQ